MQEKIDIDIEEYVWVNDFVRYWLSDKAVFAIDFDSKKEDKLYYQSELPLQFLRNKNGKICCYIVLYKWKKSTKSLLEKKSEFTFLKNGFVVKENEDDAFIYNITKDLLKNEALRLRLKQLVIKLIRGDKLDKLLR